jgi:hypothetical protein
MNFNFIEKIPLNSSYNVMNYEDEINKLKKIVTDQSDKINELITIVNILKTSSQNIIHDYLTHMTEYHSSVSQSTPEVTLSNQSVIESESEEYDYGELDSEIESDTDTEEYKQLVDETYDKIFNESESDSVIEVDLNGEKVGQKRSRGRPPNKERVFKKLNVEIDKESIIKEIKCPNTKQYKSYVVSNYTLKKYIISNNKKHTILELSNNKKYCFGKDFAFAFYNNCVCLTNIIRRTLTHIEDYIYIKIDSEKYNKIRILLTKLGVLRAINYIRNNKKPKTLEQMILLEEYLEFANELD